MDTALNWRNDSVFVLDGVDFVCSTWPMEEKSTSDRFHVIKARWSVERYEQLIRLAAPKRIIELGIYDGGSTAFIALLAKPSKLLAIDLTPEPCLALESFLDEHDLRPSVATSYGVDQGDIKTLSDILDRDAGGEPWDLVIDDASHLVDETRRSFNLLFPRLKPGGVYLIEDWSWAHNEYPPLGARRQVVPLSVLVFELMLAGAHCPGAIDEVVVRKGWATVRRGPEAIEPDSFDISSLYGEVGLELMGHLTSPSASWGQADAAGLSE